MLPTEKPDEPSLSEEKSARQAVFNGMATEHVCPSGTKIVLAGGEVTYEDGTVVGTVLLNMFPGPDDPRAEPLSIGMKVGTFQTLISAMHVLTNVMSEVVTQNGMSMEKTGMGAALKILADLDRARGPDEPPEVKP